MNVQNIIMNIVKSVLTPVIGVQKSVEKCPPDKRLTRSKPRSPFFAREGEKIPQTRQTHKKTGLGGLAEIIKRNRPTRTGLS
ncbi:hypothetical protein [uncultured Klebsiella sp.]|uniref:hypothetical protein n=1 Tax=uncultured Klebsiella sp. TaxID=284011 RepID=UPI0028041F8A|nr:hypothetical protein [uncultured Klebsiella sp.]